MDLPVVDLAPYLQAAAAAGAAPADAEEAVRALCATVSASLRDTGALLVKDPRCSAADNDRFLDVVERYFARSAESKRLQERPHLHYQVKMEAFM
jgi:DNA-binding transcriptional regulator YbjK